MNPCIVIPVHNRCEITLRCLQNLARQDVFSWAHVIVVDDGSTDGTAERISREYPKVSLMYGDGSLWWAGAMEKGMRWAMQQGAPQVFWLNDDCYPRKGSMEALRDYSRIHQCITVGQAVTPAGFKYGGFRKSHMWFVRLDCDPTDVLVCDTFNGNCVCIPRQVVESIGLPDACTLPHALADTDYGLRAGKAGFQSIIIGQALCDNGENETARSWLSDDVPLRDIWRFQATPKGLHYWRDYPIFCVRHWGLWGIVIAVIPYFKLLGILWFRLVGPRTLRQRWVGRQQRQRAV